MSPSGERGPGGREGVPAGAGEADRRAAVDALCEAFAQDRFGLEEFERRVDRANRAGERAELRSLLADLPYEIVPAHLRSGSPTGSVGPPAHGGEREGVPAPAAGSELARRARPLELAIWSGQVRRGRWVPARRTTAVAIMGSVELDLREAELAPGVTEISVFSLMGGIEILVPPWVRVEGGAFAFLGAYSEDEETGVESGPDSPVVRITGFIMLGGADVIVRYPGESAKDAKRRRKEERRRGS